MSCSQCKYNRRTSQNGKWVACSSLDHAKFMDECGSMKRYQGLLRKEGSFPIVSADHLRMSCHHFVDRKTDKAAPILY